MMNAECGKITRKGVNFRILHFVFISLICALACAIIWGGEGLLNTRARGDSPFLLQRVFELSAELRAGHFPARWMPDASYGLGYPFFNFYAAFPYYIASALNVLGMDLLISIKFTQTLGMFAAAGAMWLFARRHLSEWGAVLAAIAYALAPFHLVNIYVRGDSLSEFYAFIWFPLILAGLDNKSHRSQRPVRFIPFALSLAGLLLTHNVSALIFAPVALAYALVRLMALAPRERASYAAQVCAGGLMALALGAWFWLPALAEARLVQLDQQTTGYFNFANHFLASNLVQSSPLVSYAADQLDNPMQMGLAQAVLALVGFALMLARKTLRKTALLFGALAAFATFMLTPASAFVWDHVPLLAMAQFPWRFLSVQAVFTSLLIGAIFPLPREGLEARVGQRVGSGVAVGILAALLAFVSLAQLPNQRLNITSDDVTPQTLAQYEWLSTNIGTTIRGEYLPREVNPRPWRSLLLAREAGSEFAITISEDHAPATFPITFWPGWRGTAQAADGRVMQFTPSADPGTGWVMADLPRGSWRVSFTLARTPIEQIAEIISLIALVGLFLVSYFFISKKSLLWVMALAALVALFAFAPKSLPAAQPITNEFVQAKFVDFESRPFPHRGPLQFVAADGQTYELSRVMFAPQTARPGDAITLRLEWRDGRAPPDVRLIQEAPSGLLDPRADLIFRFARAESAANATQTTHIILPEQTPGQSLFRLEARDAGGAVMNIRIGTSLVSKVYEVGPVIEPISRPLPAQTLRTFENGIRLHTLDWFAQDGQHMCIRPTWSIAQQAGAAWQVSIRLRGADGREIARADGQPIGGEMPTWAWLPNSPVNDSYCGAPFASAPKDGEKYEMEIIWYRAFDQKELGRATLGGVVSLAPFALNQPR